jgi:hypothetical protein
MSGGNLKAYISYLKADSALAKSAEAFRSLSPDSREEMVLNTFSNYKSAATLKDEFLKQWKRVKPQDSVVGGYNYIRGKIKDYFNSLESFSGESSYRLSWKDNETEIGASTYTNKGETYSRKCTYRKTDATHYFDLNYEWAAQLVEYQDITDLSFQEHCPLLGLKKLEDRDFSIKGLGRKDGPNKDRIKMIESLKNNLKGNIIFRAKWVKGNKAIKKQDGFIAARGSAKNNNLVIFHSEKSPEHALKGLNQKLLAKKNEERQRRMVKNGRGALFGQKTINLKEVQLLTGWCGPGCRGWLNKYMEGKTKAPYHIVADAAHKAANSGDMYGKRLLELLGIKSGKVNYTDSNPFTIWIK